MTYIKRHNFPWQDPPRPDLHRINLKVSSYNNLVSQKLRKLENVSVIETLSLGLRLFYKDRLHLSNLGFKRICGTGADLDRVVRFGKPGQIL